MSVSSGRDAFSFHVVNPELSRCRNQAAPLLCNSHLTPECSTSVKATATELFFPDSPLTPRLDDGESGAVGRPQPVHHTSPVLEAHYLLPSPLQQGGGAHMPGAQDQAPSAALLNSNPTLDVAWVQGLSFKRKIPGVPVNAALLSSSAPRHPHRVLPAHAGPGGQRHDLCYLSNCAISTCARRQARPPSPGRAPRTAVHTPRKGSSHHRAVRDPAQVRVGWGERRGVAAAVTAGATQLLDLGSQAQYLMLSARSLGSAPQGGLGVQDTPGVCFQGLLASFCRCGSK